MKLADRHYERHIQKSSTLPSINRKDIGEPVFTATKQIARYTTVQGIQADILCPQKDWPEAMLKEFFTNAWDFENDFYPSPMDGGKYTKDDRWITISIRIDNIPNREDIKLFRISVCNSNVVPVEVFKNLPLTFDFDIWGSTKRGQNRGTGGSLGDYLKRALGKGYASWIEYNSDASTGLHDIQWTEPLILRFKGQEYRVFIKVDKDIGNAYADIKGPYSSDALNYIEVCSTLPISTELLTGGYYISLRPVLQNYYLRFRASKTKYTTFNYEFTDENGVTH